MITMCLRLIFYIMLALSILYIFLFCNFRFIDKFILSFFIMVILCIVIELINNIVMRKK